MHRPKMRHAAFFLLLMGGWLLFAGAVDSWVLFTGMTVVLITMVVFPSLYADVLSLTPVRRFVRFSGFVVYMLAAILVASIKLAALATRPSIPTCSRMLRYDYQVADRLGLLLLSITITLTPGTLVVDVDQERNRLYIHNLDRANVTVEETVESIRGIETRLLRVFA